MPRATVNISDTEKFALKTLEGGEVTLRRMTFGQKLARQESATKVTMEQSRRSGGKMDLNMLQFQATVFDFRACIVDHNLEDENGQKLNLTQEAAVASLDPRVGEEISKFIDKMNNFEDDLEESGFPNGSAPQ